MNEFSPLVQKIIEVAKEYRRVYQRPLSVMGEVGDHIVANQFQLDLADFQNPSFDAISKSGKKIQIKSRIFSRPQTDRIGTVKKGDYDDLLVASFNDNFALIDVYLVDSTTLESNLPVGEGKNKRNPSLNLIKRVGKSLKIPSGSWLAI